jgi:hypothetical protein
VSSTFRRTLAVAGAAVMIFALPACAKKAATSSGAIGTVGISPGVSPGAIDGGTDGTGATDGTTTGTDGGSPTPTDTATVTVTRTPTPHPTVTVTAQPKITIDEFKVTDTPRCATDPSVPVPIPAHEVTLEWKVSGNVDFVALSIDDPNFYKYNNGQGTWQSDFKRIDQVTLSFPCNPSSSDQYAVHTYTIDTIGGGAPVAKTITVKTLNHP